MAPYALVLGPWLPGGVNGMAQEILPAGRQPRPLHLFRLAPSQLQHPPPPPFLLTDAPPSSLQGSSMNYKQTATRRSRTAAPLQRSWGAALSSPWRASLCEPPPAPCLEHLAAPDLPTGVAGCPLPARPEGLGGSQQGEGSPFTGIASIGGPGLLLYSKKLF